MAVIPYGQAQFAARLKVKRVVIVNTVEAWSELVGDLSHSAVQAMCIRVMCGRHSVGSMDSLCSIPLLNWGKNKSRVEAQYARADQALQIYEDTVIRSVQEVEDAIASVETYRQEFEARTVQRVAAQNAARLSRARYDDGIAPYIEVLDIERSLFTAELGESLTYQRYLSSIVRIEPSQVVYGHRRQYGAVS